MKNIYFSCYYDFLNKEGRKAIESQLKKLKSLAFKKEVVETSKETLTRDDIEFDDKPHLFGFNNIVYDLKTHQFRDYKYDDFMSITTGYDWTEPTEDEIRNVEKLLTSIFTNDGERETILRIISTGLEGKALEKFIIFNGDGRNGKGVLNDIYLLALGGYAMIANNSMLFERRKTGCNPVLANTHKRKVCCIS